MVRIPVELKESLKKGECALFVGAGLSKGLPTWKELMKPLAKELGIKIDKEKDLRITASYYEKEFGRPELGAKIISQLQKKVPLTKSHELLADLPLKALVTTNYDHLLEKALSKKDVARIIYEREIPRIGAEELPLVKMHGDLDDTSTMVITKKDYDEYADTHKAFITYLKGLLISCNFLFVGFSLEDPNFDSIYNHIKSLFGESKRTGFAIFKNPSKYEIKRLKEDMGIEVISIEDYEEVSEIFEELHRICRKKPLVKTEWSSQELEAFQDTFCEIAEEQNKWLDPRGIFQFEKMFTRRDVELEDVYVVPRLVKQEPIRKRKESMKREERRGEKSTLHSEIGKESERVQPTRKEIEMEEYIFEKQVELTVKETVSNAKNSHMVILGDPGIGKTCLLRYIALKASTHAEALGIKRLLPVLIPLREYPEFGRKQGKLFKEFVFYYIKDQICLLPDEVLQYFLEKNLFFFLLDGLDEVVSESERIQISRQVEHFMAQYSNTRMILTSRPAGYRAAALIGAIPHFTLAEFNDDEITEFLVKWFTFLEKIEEEHEGEAEEIANNLKNIILERERISHLARNPLLLTILVLIHRVGKQLPERRAEFYEYAVRTVAVTWEKWKSLHTGKKIPDQDTILASLEKIGFLLHSQKEENTVETEELKSWLREALDEEIGHSSREEITDFIWMLNQRAGLLAERGLGLYGFVHLTFQEYFAARYIAVGRGTDLAQNLIKSNLYSSRWKEVFLLAAAIAPPRQTDFIFDSILQADNDFEEYIRSNLLFAGEALGDQPRISESKRNDIITRLKSLTGSDHIDLLRIEALQTLMRVRRVFQFEDAWALELLKDKDRYVRSQAVRYFTTVGAEDPKIKEKFFELLKDEDSDVCSQAVRYFTTVGAEDPKIKEKFFELLRDEAWNVRSLAVRYFTTVGAEDPKIKEKFFELLKDKDWDVRSLAVRYFTTVGAEDPKIKEKIFELLKDEDQYVCYQAVRYFTTVGAEDPKIKEKFFELLRDEAWNVRSLAVRYFTTVGAEDPKIKEKIFELLKDEDSDVCSQAVRYFTTVGAEDPKIKEKIFELLKDEAWNVRSLAVRYFTTVGAEDPKIKEKIFELLKDEDSDVCSQAVRYFTTVGAEDPKIKEKIFELLKDEDSDVCSQAVRYFTTVGAEDPKIKEKIFELLKDESYSIFSDKRTQDIAVEYLSKYARRESKKRAPDLFTSKNEPTRRGAYKLMKALLTAQ